MGTKKEQEVEAAKAAEAKKLKFARTRVKKGWDSRPCLVSDVEMYKKLGFVEVK